MIRQEIALMVLSSSSDFAEAEERLGREKELGDRAARPGVELALEIIEIGVA